MSSLGPMLKMGCEETGEVYQRLSRRLLLRKHIMVAVKNLCFLIWWIGNWKAIFYWFTTTENVLMRTKETIFFLIYVGNWSGCKMYIEKFSQNFWCSQDLARQSLSWYDVVLLIAPLEVENWTRHSSEVCWCHLVTRVGLLSWTT